MCSTLFVAISKYVDALVSPLCAKRWRHAKSSVNHTRIIDRCPLPVFAVLHIDYLVFREDTNLSRGCKPFGMTSEARSKCIPDNLFLHSVGPIFFFAQLALCSDRARIRERRRHLQHLRERRHAHGLGEKPFANGWNVLNEQFSANFL